MWGPFPIHGADPCSPHPVGRPKAGLAPTQSSCTCDGEGTDRTEPVTCFLREGSQRRRISRELPLSQGHGRTAPGGPAGEAPGPLLMAGLPTPSQTAAGLPAARCPPPPQARGLGTVPLGLRPAGGVGSCQHGRLPVPLRALPGRSPQNGRPVTSEMGQSGPRTPLSEDRPLGGPGRPRGWCRREGLGRPRPVPSADGRRPYLRLWRHLAGISQPPPRPLLFPLEFPEWSARITQSGDAAAGGSPQGGRGWEGRRLLLAELTWGSGRSLDSPPHRGLGVPRAGPATADGAPRRRSPEPEVPREA